RSAEIEPRRADPLVGLGDALLRQGRARDAVRAYRRALEVDPAEREAPVHLAIALVRAGRPAEALPALHGPQPPPAEHALLARPRAPLADPRSAVRRYRDSVRRRPDSGAASELAWILATSPEPDVRDADEAVRLAEAALREETPGAAALDALGAAYAAAGRFDEAAAQARAAAELAGRADPRLAAAARAREELYRSGRPYVASGVDRLR